MVARATLYSIPSSRPFADSLVAGILHRFGREPMDLARGRIILPNNRAVRTVTEAFVRASGGGLLMPRLIPIGDPDLDERVGGALDPLEFVDAVPPAIDPLQRLFTLAHLLKRGERGSTEALRLAADLESTLDSLIVEEIDPRRLATLFDDYADFSLHWQKSLTELAVLYSGWPKILAERGLIDLSERRNRLLDLVARRWTAQPPTGFTIAAGISTSAPAIARLLTTVAELPEGEVVFAGLWLADVLPEPEWDGLDREPAHPQSHLKLLLDRMGFDRSEVESWQGRSAVDTPARRMDAIANAMAAPAFSSKWVNLPPGERRLSNVRMAEFPDPASEAQGIAIALRGAIEEKGRTAALVTPDRILASRVVALLKRWGIEADDSAGTPLSHSASGTLVLAIVAAMAEDMAPVALLAMLKHPLAASGDGQDRLAWLDRVRRLDLALRGPRPPAGLEGIERALEGTDAAADWLALRAPLRGADSALAIPRRLSQLAESVVAVAAALAGDAAWKGADGRSLAEFLAKLQALTGAGDLEVSADEAVPVFRHLLDRQSLRPPYGGHPRVFIWGLLEARLQRADMMVLGGLNEGNWPRISSPDPWLPPQVRRALGMPPLESRIGLSAQDFAGALGAPEVLITRARRDERSPTVPSRLWLRLRALDPDKPLDRDLPAWALAIDRPAEINPVERPVPEPSPEQRPKAISVTDVDRLKSDPFSFYARKILRLPVHDPVDADPSAAWKGTAVHDVLEAWLNADDCKPEALAPRITAMLSDDAVHPLQRALWRPRLEQAIAWVAQATAEDRALGRLPLKAEVKGEAEIAGVILNGKADRIDRLPGGGVAIVDYKTGKAPEPKAIASGFALQLGLLGLIARAGGFGPEHARPESFEYWSLAKHKGKFGYRRDAAGEGGASAFLAMTTREFSAAAGDWLTGTRGFEAKLNPAQSRYGDYDQLMRLEEWYARL